MGQKYTWVAPIIIIVLLSKQKTIRGSINLAPQATAVNLASQQWVSKPIKLA